jgi:hypothetical protein
VRRVAAVAAVLLAVGASGCGVQPTGVIDAGEPAEGVLIGSPVYFVRDGRLASTIQPGLARGDLAGALAAVAAGPDDAQRAAGLTSELPPAMGQPSVARSRDGLALRIAISPLNLSSLALAQLACTVSAALGKRVAGSGVLIAGGGDSVVAPPCLVGGPAPATTRGPVRGRGRVLKPTPTT